MHGMRRGEHSHPRLRLFERARGGVPLSPPHLDPALPYPVPILLTCRTYPSASTTARAQRHLCVLQAGSISDPIAQGMGS